MWYIEIIFYDNGASGANGANWRNSNLMCMKLLESWSAYNEWKPQGIKMTEDVTQSLKSIAPIMEGTVSKIKGGQGCDQMILQ